MRLLKAIFAVVVLIAAVLLLLYCGFLLTVASSELAQAMSARRRSSGPLAPQATKLPRLRDLMTRVLGTEATRRAFSKITM